MFCFCLFVFFFSAPPHWTLVPISGIEPIPLAVKVLSPNHWTSRVLLLLLSRFSRVRLCATPKTAVHQAPPSLGFSRQEHWSGVPFPSPMHESETEVTQLWLLATPWTAAHQAPPSLGFSRQEYWSRIPFLLRPRKLGFSCCVVLCL